MNRLPEIELMRLLHGDLPPERAFELKERLAREPELARELARLEATWERLELPPAAPAPRGFARAVVARAEGAGLWSAAPTRVRLLGGALLAAGLALGVGLSVAAREVTRGEAPLVASAPAVSAAPAAVPTDRTAEAAAPEAPVAPAAPAPRVPSAGPAGGEAVAPSADPADAGRGSEPEGAPSFDRMAELDFDLSAGGESFGDEGTLADDFWQAFDETDGASGALDGESESESL